MLNERHQKILQLLEAEKCITVQDLSEMLEVSLVTIRKDLTALENDGHLYRTHGGASRKSHYAFEENVIKKETIQVEAKQKIARKALEFIKDNEFIILASGTTIHYLARILGERCVTVLTASLRASIELCRDSNVKVIKLGGEVRKSSASVVGAFAEDMLRNFSCNKLFLGVDGIDVDFGISTSNANEAHLNQVMIEQSDVVFVLADSSKINKRSFAKICDVNKINFFISDNMIEEEDVKKLEDAGVQVIIADQL